MDPLNIPAKLEVRSFTRAWDNIIIIIIINEIYRAQNSQGQQMRQVSCCMIQLS